MTDMLSNKKLNSIVTELFIRGRKLNISLVFITKSHFAVPKNIRSNSSYYCIMKIPNKREHEQHFKTLWIYIKNILQKHIFLVIDATLASDNLSSFRKNFVVRIQKLIITITDLKIRDEKLQYDINREAVQISALSSGKIDKYEYLTGEEVLSFHQKQTIKQAKFAYSTLEKALKDLSNKD